MAEPLSLFPGLASNPCHTMYKTYKQELCLQAALHMLPGKSSLNVRSVCPVPVCPVCPGFPICPDDHDDHDEHDYNDNHNHDKHDD